MKHFSCPKICFILFLFFAAMVISSSAQTFTLLATFDTTNGALPRGALVQGLDGNFYGVTNQGGRQQCAGGCGTVFKVTTDGTLTTIHEFVSAEGSYPMAGLVLATDSNFYGLTGGRLAPNEPFKIAADGTFTVLSPYAVGGPAALIQDTVNGNFYGTGFPAGGNDPVGAVFGMTASGALTMQHDFCGQNSCGGTADGYNPLGGLVEDVGNGLLYGTTDEGSEEKCFEGTNHTPSDCGTVFVIGTGGAIKTVHRFVVTDGAFPTGALIQGNDGNFYGTTAGGGTGFGGTVFKMTPTGGVTLLYNFCPMPAACPDGGVPEGGVIQATDGNFYGTTNIGGTGTGVGCPCGTVYQLTPGGTLTALHNFDDTDGRNATAALVQGTDGNLYGTTTGYIAGKTVTEGTIFKISLGLAPFVKTLPLAAHPGTQIFILGTDLTGATSVTFNGVSAAFTVVSATEITATVPAGGSSGTVQVVTPSGTLSSNVPFRVY